MKAAQYPGEDRRICHPDPGDVMVTVGKNIIGDPVLRLKGSRRFFVRPLVVPVEVFDSGEECFVELDPAHARDSLRIRKEVDAMEARRRLKEVPTEQ